MKLTPDWLLEFAQTHPFLVSGTLIALITILVIGSRVLAVNNTEV